MRADRPGVNEALRLINGSPVSQPMRLMALVRGGEVGYGATPSPLWDGRWIATLVWNSLGST